MIQHHIYDYITYRQSESLDRLADAVRQLGRETKNVFFLKFKIFIEEGRGLSDRAGN
jgi:hypothetical protein